MIDIMMSDRTCDPHEEKLIQYYIYAFDFDYQTYDNYKKRDHKESVSYIRAEHMILI